MRLRIGLPQVIFDDVGWHRSIIVYDMDKDKGVPLGECCFRLLNDEWRFDEDLKNFLGEDTCAIYTGFRDGYELRDALKDVFEADGHEVDMMESLRA